MKKRRMITIGKIILVVIMMIPVLFIFRILEITAAIFTINPREELRQNFVNHEKEFADLDTYFHSMYPKEKAARIWFEINGRRWFQLDDWNSFHVIVYPKVDSGKPYKQIGGFDLELGSPQMDSVIAFLGWTNNTLKQLRSKLVDVNCDKITCNEGGIGIFQKSDGISTEYMYTIYDKSVSKDTTKIYHKSISNSELGKRTVI